MEDPDWAHRVQTAVRALESLAAAPSLTPEWRNWLERAYCQLPAITPAGAVDGLFSATGDLLRDRTEGEAKGKGKVGRQLECWSCGCQVSVSHFSPSQHRKAVETRQGRCLSCVELFGSCIPCSACGRQLSLKARSGAVSDGFSKNQLAKPPLQRRCKSCVSGAPRAESMQCTSASSAAQSTAAQSTADAAAPSAANRKRQPSAANRKDPFQVGRAAWAELHPECFIDPRAEWLREREEVQLPGQCIRFLGPAECGYAFPWDTIELIFGTAGAVDVVQLTVAALEFAHDQFNELTAGALVALNNPDDPIDTYVLFAVAEPAPRVQVVSVQRVDVPTEWQQPELDLLNQCAQQLGATAAVFIREQFRTGVTPEPQTVVLTACYVPALQHPLAFHSVAAKGSSRILTVENAPKVSGTSCASSCWWVGDNLDSLFRDLFLPDAKATRTKGEALVLHQCNQVLASMRDKGHKIRVAPNVVHNAESRDFCERSGISTEQLFEACGGEARARKMSGPEPSNKIDTIVQLLTDMAPFETPKLIAKLRRAVVQAPSQLIERDADGWTALMYAAYMALPAAVSLLIELHADVNTEESTRGHTALHLATISNEQTNLAKPEVIRCLLHHGAMHHLRNKDGYTALEYCQSLQAGILYGGPANPPETASAETLTQIQTQLDAAVLNAKLHCALGACTVCCPTPSGLLQTELKCEEDQAASTMQTFKICGRCRGVWYADVECQRAHWKLYHKKDCVKAGVKAGVLPATIQNSLNPRTFAVRMF